MNKKTIIQLGLNTLGIILIKTIYDQYKSKRNKNKIIRHIETKFKIKTCGNNNLIFDEKDCVKYEFYSAATHKELNILLCKNSILVEINNKFSEYDCDEGIKLINKIYDAGYKIKETRFELTISSIDSS